MILFPVRDRASRAPASLSTVAVLLWHSEPRQGRFHPVFREDGPLLIEFTAKTTGELTASEVLQLRELFVAVYQKPFPEDLLRRKYAGSCLGHSFHSLMLDGGRIVGAFSAIPVRYRFF